MHDVYRQNFRSLTLIVFIITIVTNEKQNMFNAPIWTSNELKNSELVFFFCYSNST